MKLYLNYKGLGETYPLGNLGMRDHVGGGLFLFRRQWVCFSGFTAKEAWTRVTPHGPFSVCGPIQCTFTDQVTARSGIACQRPNAQ